MSFPPEPFESNISGIYNYCFRWCERCPFTDRCGNYQLLDELDEDHHRKEVQRVFRQVPKFFSDALSSLKRSCERANYDWAAIKFEVDKEEVGPPEIGLRELDQLSRQFTVALLRWVGEYRNQVKPASWHDAQEVLQWYGALLSSKTHRAVNSIEEPWPDMPADNSAEGITSDGNGTAKIALLAMARCLGALSVMLEEPAGFEEELLTFTLDILRMQQSLRHFYPYVNAFERVAFDEEDYQEEIEAYYEGHLPLDPFRDGPWTAVGRRAPQEEARR
jgi:hypothetical protein